MNLRRLAFLIPLIFIPIAAMAQDVYYQSGDVVFRDGNYYIAAPNGAGVDILNLSKDGKLSLISRSASKGQPFSAVFAKDNNETVIIVASGRYLEKFYLEDLERPVLSLVREIPGHYFYHAAKIPDNDNMVLLSSTQGVELRLVNDFSLVDVITEEPSLGAFWSKSGFIPIVSQNKIILGSAAGELISWSDFKQEVYLRAPYAGKNFGYFPTDSGLARLSPSGDVKVYRPKTIKGHAVLVSSDDKYVYFANGWGVIKLDANLKFIKSTPLSGGGFWAAGLSWAKIKDKDYIVVYNGKGVRVIDKDLKVLSSWEAPKFAFSKELKVDVKEMGEVSRWQISGSGFYPGEDVMISIGGQIFTYLRADNFGAFTVNLNLTQGDLLEAKGALSGLVWQSAIR